MASDEQLVAVQLLSDCHVLLRSPLITLRSPLDRHLIAVRLPSPCDCPKMTSNDHLAASDRPRPDAGSRHGAAGAWSEGWRQAACYLERPVYVRAGQALRVVVTVDLATGLRFEVVEIEEIEAQAEGSAEAEATAAEATAESTAVLPSRPSRRRTPLEFESLFATSRPPRMHVAASLPITAYHFCMVADTVRAQLTQPSVRVTNPGSESPTQSQSHQPRVRVTNPEAESPAQRLRSRSPARSPTLALLALVPRPLGRCIPPAPVPAPVYPLHLSRDRQVRNVAYRAAIERAVRARPGCSLMDIGAGTGLLGLIGARAGAGRVDCVEMNDTLAAVARATLEARAACTPATTDCR